jgi:hypothetical protein
MTRAAVAVITRESATDVERVVDLQIVAGVDLATHYYRHGQRGRGAYELARLAMRVNRLLDHQQQGESHAV